MISFQTPNSKRSALKSPLTDLTSKGKNGEAQVLLHSDSKLAQQKATLEEAPREKELLKFSFTKAFFQLLFATMAWYKCGVLGEPDRRSVS